MDALDSSTLAQILHPKLCAYKPGKQEIINAYLMMTRSSEEIEMQNVVHYYENRIYTIEEIMDSISQQGSEYGRGAYALLFNLHHSAKEHLEKCNHLF